MIELEIQEGRLSGTELFSFPAAFICILTLLLMEDKRANHSNQAYRSETSSHLFHGNNSTYGSQILSPSLASRWHGYAVTFTASPQSAYFVLVQQVLLGDSSIMEHPQLRLIQLFHRIPSSCQCLCDYRVSHDANVTASADFSSSISHLPNLFSPLFVLAYD